MPVNANATKLANLVNPEVLAPIVTKKLVDNIRYAPLARIDTTLQGQPGDTITLPNFNYIGDAEVVAEGEDLPIRKLTSATAKVQIYKAGLAVEVTDESVLSGYGDPIGEAAKQIGVSIATKIDNDMITVLNGISIDMTKTIPETISSDGLADALTLFAEDLGSLPMVMPISPKQLAILRKSEGWLKATDIGAQIIMSGAVGALHGVQFVLSNKVVEAGGNFTNFIIQQGALALYMKRNVLLESDRDIIARSTVLAADQHYAPYLFDASKAIKVVSAAA